MSRDHLIGLIEQQAIASLLSREAYVPPTKLAQTEEDQVKITGCLSGNSSSSDVVDWCRLNVLEALLVPAFDALVLAAAKNKSDDATFGAVSRHLKWYTTLIVPALVDAATAPASLSTSSSSSSSSSSGASQQQLHSLRDDLLQCYSEVFVPKMLRDTRAVISRLHHRICENRDAGSIIDPGDLKRLCTVLSLHPDSCAEFLSQFVDNMKSQRQADLALCRDVQQAERFMRLTMRNDEKQLVEAFVPNKAQQAQVMGEFDSLADVAIAKIVLWNARRAVRLVQMRCPRAETREVFNKVASNIAVFC